MMLDLEATNSYGYVREATMDERRSEIFIDKKVPELIYTIEKDGSSQMYALPIPTFQRYTGSRTYGVVEHPTTMSNYENQLVKSSSPEYTLTLRLLDTIKVTSITTSGASMLTWSRESVLDTLKYLGSKGITFDIVGDDPIYNDLTDLLFVKIDDQKEVGDTHTIDVTITCRKQRFSEVGYATIPEYIIGGMGNQDEVNGIKDGFYEWFNADDGAWSWMVSNIPIGYRDDHGFTKSGTGYFRARYTNGLYGEEGKIPICGPNLLSEVNLQLRCLLTTREALNTGISGPQSLGRFWLKDSFYIAMKPNTTLRYKNILMVFKKDGYEFSSGGDTKDTMKIYVLFAKEMDPLFATDTLSSIGSSKNVIDSFMYTYPNLNLTVSDLYQLKDVGILGDLQYSLYKNSISENYKANARKIIADKIYEMCSVPYRGGFRYLNEDGTLESNPSFENKETLILQEMPLNSENVRQLMSEYTGFITCILPLFFEAYGENWSNTHVDGIYKIMRDQGWRAYNVKVLDCDNAITFEVGRKKADPNNTTELGKPEAYYTNLKLSSFPVKIPNIEMQQYVKINGNSYLVPLICTMYIYKVGNNLLPVFSVDNTTHDYIQTWK